MPKVKAGDGSGYILARMPIRKAWLHGVGEESLRSFDWYTEWGYRFLGR
jgi:hypothetical protein